MHLEGEEVLPLCHTHMELCDHTTLELEETVRIVFERTERPDSPLQEGDPPERETGDPMDQIDYMDALIEEMPPTRQLGVTTPDRKSTRLNSSHVAISY